MSITKGQEIKASDWNSYTRARAKTRVGYLSKEDKFGDSSAPASGNFWVRSSGWNWPDFYELKEVGYSYDIDAEIALVEGSYTLAVKNTSGLATTEIPTGSGTDWEVYRYEFGYKTIDVGDEIVYGGGLFKSTTGSELAPEAPLMVVNTGTKFPHADPNYIAIHADNMQVHTRGAGFIVNVDIYLLKLPSASEVHFLDAYHSASNDTNEYTTFWAAPGYYRYALNLNDVAPLTYKTGKAGVSVQQYDDNVKQYKTLRTFNTTISDLNLLNAGLYGEITASRAQTDPRLTDDDIEKKGGYVDDYTGDW